MNTKLHAVTNQNGRPLDFFMTAGQISDYTGAELPLILLLQILHPSCLIGFQTTRISFARDNKSVR